MSSPNRIFPESLLPQSVFPGFSTACLLFFPAVLPDFTEYPLPFSGREAPAFPARFYCYIYVYFNRIFPVSTENITFVPNI
jgi:hypothetical protein